MKKIACLLLASLSLCAAAEASAQQTGLTRAQVKQQLVQAEAKGQIPSNGTDYPPSAQTMARNRAAYHARHKKDAVSGAHKSN